jgi:acetyl esterase/lipase
MRVSHLNIAALLVALLAGQVAAASPAATLPTGDHATGVQPTERQVAARAVSQQLYDELPADLTIARDIIYSDADEEFCRLDVLQLAEREGSAPVILKFHGGGLSGGDKSWHRDVLAMWAREGFTIVTANYRMSPEYTWPAMIEDADAALRWIGANAEEHDLDPSNVVITGDSAGAYLSVALATMSPELFPNIDTSRPTIRAVVAWYGAYTFVPRPGIEWSGWGTSPTWPVMPVPRDQDVALWELASPINHVDASDPPMLLIHGVRDSVIPYSQSLVFAQEAWRNEAKVELRLIPQMEHSFRPAPPNDPTVPTQREGLMRESRETLEFFKRHIVPEPDK